ncbi:hypothetical protein MOQ72_34745 [Saccharopolyspora sp. K220]|uniref:hypothetical protein n=1 Tax=Saccharopolyspora soli TaxID=2926618 RepID=UPI001F572484|nr:hypothetical protein [Saccharopolyspora soli]MCI2422600.1 hypothetical protein [Saccharopolyspora soli]
MVRKESESRQQDSDETEKKPKKLDLSPPQVAGAALASVTAAFLGSRLGVAGTVVGAGLTSVVITVGGALYQRSLENAKQKAAEVAAKASEKRSKRTEVARYVSTKDGKIAATRRIHLTPGMHWPGGERVVDEPTRQLDDQPAKVDAEAATRMLSWDGSAPTEAVAARPDSADRRKRQIRWAMVAASCAVAFVLSMLIITGFEGVTGRPLSGGERGTTLGRVLHQDSQPTPTAPTDTDAPPETGSEQPQPTTEVEPTQQPTEQPTQQPTPTTEPSQSPTSQQQTSAPESGAFQPRDPAGETGVLPEYPSGR